MRAPSGPGGALGPPHPVREGATLREGMDVPADVPIRTSFFLRSFR